MNNCIHAKLLQSSLTLCDPTDRSPPGSSLHGILQARILERLAMPSSRESSQPRDRTHVSYCLLHWQAPPGKTSEHLLSEFLGESDSRWGWDISELELVKREDLEGLP